MKKMTKLAGVLSLALLAACGGPKIDATQLTNAIQQNLGTTKEFDLSNSGLDGLEIAVMVPDTLHSKLKASKSDYTGTIDIVAGAAFKMMLTSNAVFEDDTMEVSLKTAMGTVKHNIDETTCKFIVNEPNAVIWEYKNDAGQVAYHVFAVFPDGTKKSTYYSISDNDASPCSESAAKCMLEMGKTIKPKPSA